MRILLTIIAAASLSACHSAQPAKATQEERVSSMKWTATLQSHGGFSGRGVGGIVVDSGGHAQIRTHSGAQETDLAAADRDRIARAIIASLADKWKSPPDPKTGADLINWSLSIDADGDRRTIDWREDVHDQLPQHVRDLVDALNSVRSAAAAH